MAVERMDNMGIVVEGLDGTTEFFRDLGLELSRFLDPPVLADHRNAPVNSLGSITRTHIGSAISGAPAAFSSGSPKI